MSSSSASKGGHKARALRVLQLTDTHLYADPDGRLLGQNTRQTLEMVLDLACRALAPMDLILLTGDLVHDESPEGYRYLKQRLTALGRPFCCLPGNHDSLAIMLRTLENGLVSTETCVRESGWNLVLLDSTIPGRDGGHLDQDQLERLQDSLSARPKDPALICLHHQPVPVGSAWIDTMALDNPEAFFGIMDRHSQVRAILWGHVHQEFSGNRNGVRLLGSPSTCVQFLPGSRYFAVDTRTPGFRWLKLHRDGRIDTGVERIDSYPDPVVLITGGY
jgi:Icc protein